MALHEIVYMSLACETMSPEQLAGLMDHARAHNKAAGITGMLIHHEREFMQLLEGERSVIEALYDKIAGDPRHQQMYRLWDAPITSRSFNDWTMGFLSIDDETLEQHSGFSSLRDDGLVSLGQESNGKKFLLRLRDELLT